MLTDAELIDLLRRKYGHSNVADTVEVHGGRRYLHINRLPVRFEDAYDEVAGPGAYVEAVGRAGADEGDP
jgi:hypothetical protein